ncbi:MAG: permease, partial [Puniceicoccales bacterium]
MALFILAKIQHQMDTDKLTIAFNEFVHVGGALVIVIAVVSILTGFMREYIPQEKLQKKLTKHERFGPLLGAVLGMLTPFCSASVVPVTLGMATMGVSLGTVLSFLISAPLCNFIVIAMVYAVFGLKITASYFAITFTAAILGGWLITKTPWRNEIKRGDELEKNKNQTSCAAMTPCCADPEPEPSCTATPNCGESTTQCGEPSKPKLAMRFAWVL